MLKPEIQEGNLCWIVVHVGELVEEVVVGMERPPKWEIQTPKMRAMTPRRGQSSGSTNRRTPEPNAYNYIANMGILVFLETPTVHTWKSKDTCNWIAVLES